MIGLIDIVRGAIELIVQGLVAWHRREDQVGKPPRLEARRRERLDRLGPWLRFRGASGGAGRRDPRL